MNTCPICLQPYAAACAHPTLHEAKIDPPCNVQLGLGLPGHAPTSADGQPQRARVGNTPPAISPLVNPYLELDAYL